MTKKEIWDNVKENVLAVANKYELDNSVKLDIMAVLSEYLKPKVSRDGTDLYPDITENGQLFCYDRYTNRYYIGELSVISNGKGKGASKASLSLWKRTKNKIEQLSKLSVAVMLCDEISVNQVIKDLEKLEITKTKEEILSNTIEVAKEIGTIAKELQDTYNEPSFYNKKEIWDYFFTNNKDYEQYKDKLDLQPNERF